MIGLQTMMCTFITFFILYVTDAESVGSREFLKCFLTPCRVGYWFITTYLCFYLTVPVLQFIERKAVLCGFEKPLFAAASAIPVFSFLFGSSRFGTIGTFFALFFICAYLKRRKGNFLERHCAAIFIAAFTFIVSAMCVVNYFGSKTMYIRKAEDMGHYLFPLYASREVIVMTEALALFYIFKRFVRISHSSVINAIARTTLGVYVISDNWMFILYTNGRSRYRGGFLFEHLLHGGQMFFSSRYYALYFIAVVSGVFIVCSLIEYVRSLVFDRLILDHCSCFTALCGKFDAWYRLL